MRTVSLTVDVWCKYEGEPPIYRVYVDTDLLTERTFIWQSGEQYIREHIEVNLVPGVHWVSVEKVSEFCTFYIKNVTVDGTLLESSHGKSLTTVAKFNINT